MAVTVFPDTKFLHSISAQLSLIRPFVQELMLCKMEVSVSVHLELIISVENARYVLQGPSLMELAANNLK